MKMYVKDNYVQAAQFLLCRDVGGRFKEEVKVEVEVDVDVDLDEDDGIEPQHIEEDNCCGNRTCLIF